MLHHQSVNIKPTHTHTNKFSKIETWFVTAKPLMVYLCISLSENKKKYFPFWNVVFFVRFSKCFCNFSLCELEREWVLVKWIGVEVKFTQSASICFFYNISWLISTITTTTTAVIATTKKWLFFLNIINFNAIELTFNHQVDFYLFLFFFVAGCNCNILISEVIIY